MVQVPTAPQRRVQVQAPSDARFRYAESRNFIGEALQGAGQALSDAARGWDGIEATRDEADAKRIANEYAAYERERLRTGENAYLQTRGFGAEDWKTAADDLKTGAENVLQGARSKRAREMAQDAINIRMGNASDTMAAHANEQLVKARDEQSASVISGAITDSIDARGTEQFAVHMGLAVSELTAMGKRQGWSPDRIQDEAEKLTSNILTQTAQAIDAEDGEPTRALEFVERYKDLIRPAEQAELVRGLTPRVDAAWARGEIEGVVERYKPPAVDKASGASAATPVENGREVAQSVYPGITVTSNRRKAGQAGKAGSRSWHVRSGAAIDAAPIQGMTFAQYVQGYRDAGYSIIEAVDETDPETMKRTGATGPHWHVVLAKGGGAGAPGVAADPRLDSSYVNSAVEARIAADPNMSERRKEALRAAGDQYVSNKRAERAQAEQDADRRLMDWLTTNKADPDSLTDLGQVPSALLQNASPSTKAQLMGRVQATRSRIQAERDAAAARAAERAEDAAVFELYTMTDEQLARTDMRRYAGVIGPDKLGPWIDRQQKAAGAKGANGPVSGDKIASAIDRYGDAIGAARVSKSGAPLDSGNSKLKKWIGLREYVERQLAGRSEKDVSAEDLRAIVLSGVQEVEAKVADRGMVGRLMWGENDTKYRYEVRDGEQFRRYDIPDTVRAQIVAKYPDASEERIADIYGRGKARGLW